MKQLILLVITLAMASIASGTSIVRHTLGPDVPIARAVEVESGTVTIYHSGVGPTPADPGAQVGSPEYWGDTFTQSRSVFALMQRSLETLGLGFGDIVKMTVFLVADPARGNKMDFDGFMRAYREHFGTRDQPIVPARSTLQVAGLVAPGMLVEIEVVLAKERQKK